jgi:septum formation topological specificity factor MinE
MPKLSQDTLEKRFPCSTCGKSFRTRQGLSGHVQYKHSKGVSPKKITAEEALQVGLHMIESAATAGFSPDQRLELQPIFVFCERIKIFLENEHMTFSKTDAKNCLIISLAQMHANQMLVDQIQREIGKVINKLVEIQESNIARILKKEQ